MVSRFLILLFVIILNVASLSGCVQNIKRNSFSAPLNQVIYSVKESQQITEKTQLALPAAVVIMFVPSKDFRSASNHVPNTTLRKAAEALKGQLLANPKYVKSVAVVSEDYLNSRMSLAQIKSMYASDIIVILSYEQDQRSYQSGLAGLMDFTIVGMFVIPGVETKTNTVIDGKVIHIPNNAMIFRANGMDERKVYSTSFGQQSTAAEESIAGVLAATTKFGNALSIKLSKFDNYDISEAVSMSVLAPEDGTAAPKTEQSNDYWSRVDTYKSRGGGTFGLIPLLLTVAVFFTARRFV